MPISETYVGPYLGPCAPSPNQLYQTSEHTKYLLHETVPRQVVFVPRIIAYHSYLMSVYFPQEIHIGVLKENILLERQDYRLCPIWPS